METKELNDNYLTLTVGKIVAKDYKKAMVFKSHGIDFCCGGKISVEQACLENGANFEQVIHELNELDTIQDTSEDFNQMELTSLIDYIVEKHHEYTRNVILQLQPMINKVAMVHGGWRIELNEIRDLFEELSQELLPHMQKEERVLFPAIKALISDEDSMFDKNQIQYPINAMEHEHDIAGRLMKEIRDLSNNFDLPKGACATYTVVYKMLAEFESDLHQHIHLENNILFPKVLSLVNNSCSL